MTIRTGADNAAVRDDPPVATDFGLVVRVLGAIVAILPDPLPVSQGLALGTYNNGVQTPVGAVAVQVLAANVNRRVAIIQNVGTTNIRVGVAGVTATTGLRLTPSSSVMLEVTSAIFAIREGAFSSTAFAQEVT